MFVGNIYLVDLVPEDTRTSALSSLAGWSALGSVLSFSIGGTITTQSRNILVVHLIAGALWAVALLYIWPLPESFPKSKREELRLKRVRQAEQTPRRWRRVLGKITAFFERLGHCGPPRHPQTGRRNWRLVICVVHMFFAGLGSGYAIPSLI
ncbi:hypothetical protein DFH07DRAFT_842624, partial [Mycena maculata]